MGRPSTTVRLAYAGTILFGGLHALASLSWGLGGTALLDTVGQAAVELRQREPVLAMTGLLLVAAIKAAGVAVPILARADRLPWSRGLRVLSWLAGTGLTAYGCVMCATAHAALAGHFGHVDDRRGMLGHAWLWDPLFALWGISLLVALAGDRWGQGRPGGQRLRGSAQEA